VNLLGLLLQVESFHDPNHVAYVCREFVDYVALRVFVSSV